MCKIVHIDGTAGTEDELSSSKQSFALSLGSGLNTGIRSVCEKHVRQILKSSSGIS